MAVVPSAFGKRVSLSSATESASQYRRFFLKTMRSYGRHSCNENGPLDKYLPGAAHPADTAYRGTAARNGCQSNLMKAADGEVSSNWRVKSSGAKTARVSTGFLPVDTSSALMIGLR